MSIKSFSISENAKVATYEYAWRNGAEHERVLNYRIFSISGIFSKDSGSKTPAYYANVLRLSNTNRPGLLVHPSFGSFKCIMHSLKITEDGSENEAYVDEFGKQEIVPNFQFEIEFWEHTDPSVATLTSDLAKLFPTINPKPLNDDYSTTLKYKTVNELYLALVDGKIISGTDPIRNAEWLLYDYTFRLEAWTLWQANPTGTSATNTITSSWQQTYIVQAGDTGMKIASKFKVSFTSLYQANKGKDVRKTPRGKEWKQWKSAGTLYSGDKLIIS